MLCNTAVTTYGAAHDLPSVRAGYARAMNDLAHDAIARMVASSQCPGSPTAPRRTIKG